jgi:hypothetical protein
MSDLYELGFTLELKQDLPREVQETLTYMIRSGAVSVEPPLLDHPFFHIEGFTTEWTYLIANPRDDDEEMLGEGCGSVLTDRQLTFRGSVHEDPFWNTWYEFIDWLSSISSSTGLIGYYCNINNDLGVTLVSFQAEGIRESACDDYSEFEGLQNQITESIENSEFVPPIIQRREADSSSQNLGELARASGYLVMRVPGIEIIGIEIIELLRPSTIEPGQMISVARSTSEDEIRQAIEQGL